MEGGRREKEEGEGGRKEQRKEDQILFPTKKSHFSFQ